MLEGLVALSDVDITYFEKRVDEQVSRAINTVVDPLILLLVFFYLLHPIQVPYLLVDRVKQFVVLYSLHKSLLHQLSAQVFFCRVDCVD